MARINIVVGPFDPTRITGGPWCVMEYAWGLTQRGHEVSVIPVVPCPFPRWFDRKGMVWVSDPWASRVSKLLSCGMRFTHEGVRRVLFRAKGISNSGREMIAAGLLATNPALYPEEVDLGVRLLHIRRALPPADVTLATTHQALLPLLLYGQRPLFYFAQHYEPLLLEAESSASRLSRFETEAVYNNSGLSKIANSLWLQEQFHAHHPATQVHHCPNAINHRVFSGMPRQGASTQEVKVISYGGRGAAWKGFREMAEAMKSARESLPGVKVRWLVYGSAAYPPENSVAPYESLGELNPPSLARAYTGADMLLSASWYESFPLFPLEAMACGLPVITTQPGTEDYAIPSQTAEIVEPRNPQSIANGLIHLVQDPDYAGKIAAAGWEMSHKFTWEKSVARMESILLGHGEP